MKKKNIKLPLIYSGGLPRSYFLPPWRSIIIGTIFICMGIAVTFGMVNYNLPFWSVLQRILISFEDLGSFLMSILMLFFKLLFFIGGYFYIRFAKGIERARLDDKGFYFRAIPAGSRLDKISLDVGKLTFMPYKEIEDVTVKKSFFSGHQLVLKTKGENQTLTALGVLGESEKREIVDIIHERIQSGKEHLRI
ncbi:hypothetical protein [Pedobacter miscanthi]|uniref:DUF304 domain-containing protein n=1 Tax=Pedobacter miscanthi TaxID=2259170 RepID=A0A366KN41_9SPHI|nr:hypothetical protein [Pedobacter miscanthi]RBQ03086.1 hypothetical protein DRW42_23675 [Pedobacter miscanthi]